MVVVGEEDEKSGCGAGKKPQGVITTGARSCRGASKGAGGDSWDRSGTGLSSDLEAAEEEQKSSREPERVARATTAMRFGAIHPGRVMRLFPVTGLELRFVLLAPSSLGFSSI